MAQKNYLVDINLNNNQLLNASLQVLGSIPSTTSLGQIYYNSATSFAYVLTGGGWVNITTPLGVKTQLTAGTDIVERSWSAKDLKDWLTESTGGYVTTVNLALGTNNSTTLVITNSAGTGFTLSSATTTLAGLMSAADKIKLNSLNNYELPIASASILGGIKVGNNLSIDGNGVLSSNYINTTYSAGTGLTLSGTTFNIIFGTTSTTVAAGNHTHDFASIINKPTTLFGYGITDAYSKAEVDVKLSSIYKVKGSVNSYSNLPTSNNVEGDVWNIIDTGDNYVWVSNLNNTNNPGWDKLAGMTNYELPTATDTILGGVRIFSTTPQSISANAITNTASRTYGVQFNSSGQLVVNVPWSDSNTTYSAGAGLTLTDTTFSVNYGTAANTAAQGNDSRFHNAVTIGTANGLSLSTQVISLSLATTSAAGAMSASDKTKLDSLGGDTYNGTFGAVGTLSYTINHNLNFKFVIPTIFETSTGNVVEMEVIANTVNQITIKMNDAPTVANQYTITVKK